MNTYLDKPTDTSLAIDCFKRGDYDEALSRAIEIVRSAPEVAISHQFLGEVLFSMGRYADSTAAFETAEQIGGPGVEQSFIWRALAQANQGDRKGAADTLRMGLSNSTLPIPVADKAKSVLAAVEGDVERQ